MKIKLALFCFLFCFLPSLPLCKTSVLACSLPFDPPKASAEPLSTNPEETTSPPDTVRQNPADPSLPLKPPASPAAPIEMENSGGIKLSLTAYPVTETLPFDFKTRDYTALADYIKANLAPNFSLEGYRASSFEGDGRSGVVYFQYNLHGFRTDILVEAKVVKGLVTEIAMNEKPESLTLPEFSQETTEAEVLRLAQEHSHFSDLQIKDQSLFKWFDTQSGEIYYIVLTDTITGSPRLFRYDLN